MVDAIGCPVKVGSSVFVSGYASSSLNTIAVVEKVNRASITVTLTNSTWDWINKKPIIEYRKMRRKSDQLIVIDQQLAYIQEHFPENLL